MALRALAPVGDEALSAFAALLVARAFEADAWLLRGSPRLGRPELARLDVHQQRARLARMPQRV